MPSFKPKKLMVTDIINIGTLSKRNNYEIIFHKEVLTQALERTGNAQYFLVHGIHIHLILFSNLF